MTTPPLPVYLLIESFLSKKEEVFLHLIHHASQMGTVQLVCIQRCVHDALEPIQERLRKDEGGG